MLGYAAHMHHACLLLIVAAVNPVSCMLGVSLGAPGGLAIQRSAGLPCPVGGSLVPLSECKREALIVLRFHRKTGT